MGTILFLLTATVAATVSVNILKEEEYKETKKTPKELNLEWEQHQKENGVW